MNAETAEKNIVENNSGTVNKEIYINDIHNNINDKILSKIYVDDLYLIRHSIKWVQTNIAKYRFNGKKSIAMRNNIIGLNAENLSFVDAKESLSEFLQLMINNPFIYENGFVKESKDCITSNELQCYFTIIKKGIIMPFGCLKDFIHNQVDKELEVFLDRCSAEMRAILKKIENNKLLFDSRMSEIDVTQSASMFKAIASAVTFVLMALYSLDCIERIDWKNISDLYLGSANLFQFIGFAAEKGFVIGHNCSLLHILLAIAIVWIVYLATTNFKFVNEYKSAKAYSKMKNVFAASKAFPKLNEALGNFSSSEVDFFAANKGSYIQTIVHPNYRLGKNSNTQKSLIEDYGLYYERTMRTNLPKHIWVTIILILALATSLLNMLAKKDEFKVWYRDSIATMQYNSQTSSLEGQKEYVVAAECDVYTKDSDEKLVLYHIQANKNCTLLHDVEEESEFANIRFFTEYGFLEGWVPKENLAEYIPVYDQNVAKIYPAECSASSELVGKKSYSPYNVLDGDITTSWQEGADGSGSGEWIRLNMNEVHQIHSIGIINGNAASNELYLANARPIGITLQFLVQDNVIDSCTYSLEDNRPWMQYITLNKDVQADSIVIRIDSANGGNEYDDACITELVLFGQ